MESIAVILILAVVAVLALWIFKYVSGNIPSMTTSEIEDIKTRIPEEFHNYVYYLDSTGVAFDRSTPGYSLSATPFLKYIRAHK